MLWRARADRSLRGLSRSPPRAPRSGITRLFPQPSGARLVFEDEKGGLFLFNPVNDHVVPVPSFTGRADNVMWDSADQNVLVIADGTSLHVYLYTPAGLAGPQVALVGRQPLPATHTPLTVFNGVVGCRLKNGAMDNVTLETHKLLQPGDAIARSVPAKRCALARVHARGGWHGAWGHARTRHACFGGGAATDRSACLHAAAAGPALGPALAPVAC